MAMQASRFTDERYPNWIKDTLALLYVKEGLEVFVDRQSAVFHGQLKIAVGSQTCTCNWRALAKGKQSWKVKCNSGICQNWLDLIISHHRYHPLPTIAKQNTDPKLWPSDCWEIMKVYQPKGCQDHHSPKDADVAGLLTLLKNCDHFFQFMGSLPLIDEILCIRNRLMHSSDFLVDNVNLTRDLQKMLQFLRCLTSLSVTENQPIQTAIDKIQELCANRLDLSLNRELELKAIRAKQVALETEMRSLDQSIKDVCTETTSVGSGLNTLQQKVVTEVQTLQLQLSSQLSMIQSIEKTHQQSTGDVINNLAHLQQQFNVLEKDLTKIKESIASLPNMKQLADHDTKLVSHQSELESHQSKLGVHDTKLVLHQSELESHQSKLGVHDTKLVSHQSELESHQSKLGDHDTKLLSHQSELESHQSKLGVHDTKLLSHQVELESHQSKLGVHDTKLLSHQTELESHQSKLADHDRSYTKLLSHQSELESHRSKLGDHDTKLLSHQSELESHQSKLGVHDTKLLSHQSELESHQSKLGDHDTKLLSHQSELESHQSKLGDQEKKLTDLEERVEKQKNDEKPQEITEADIARLQPALIKDYRRHCLLVPNPVVAEELGLEEVYVSPDIKVLRETKNPRAGLVNVQNRTTPANTSICKQIFYTEDYKSKQIYITGDAGMGKSIFCKHLVNLWCNAHSDTQSNNSEENDSDDFDCSDSDVGFSESDSHSDIQSNNSEESDSDDANSEGEYRSLLRSSSGVQQRKEVKRQTRRRTREDDRTVMSDFQLLFYITLRDSVKQYNVAEMIDSQILQLIECTKPLKASDILLTEGCLVIIDGLDEWACPENAKVPHFINPGIPGRLGLNSSNVYLTTTRPWKFDVLQLKSSEVDKHVELVGFERKSSKRLCSKIIKLLNKLEKVERTRREFWAELEKKGLDHFHNVPVILTQLICLWFDKQDLGQSQVQLYCSMLEMLLKRAVKNLPEQTCTATLKSDHTEKLLPQCFSNRPHCQAHQQLLVVLCRVAFEALFDKKRENALVFESSQMTMYGVDQSNIDVCLKSGILSQNKVLGKWSVSEKKMSFLHKKLQEFLAAIFIINCENAEKVVKQIKSFCSTVETVLEMFQVWMFVSGIRPDLSRQLMADLMTRVVLNDGRLQRARQTLTLYAAFLPPALLQSIQTCIVDCVVEARSNGHHDFCLPLEDFIIDKKTISQCLENLLTSNIAAVKSVYINADDITGDDVQTAERILCQLQDRHCLQTLHLIDPHSVITGLKPLCKTLVNSKNNLTCLVLYNITLTTELSAAVCGTLKHVTTFNLYVVSLTHEQIEQLLLSLSQADDIRQLQLWWLNCTDHDRQCRPVIDLSGHTQLHKLVLTHMYVENLAAVAHCVEHVILWHVTIAERQLLHFVRELSSTSHRVTVLLYPVTVTGDSENPVDLTHLRHNDKLVVTRCQYHDSINTWWIEFHTAADDH